MTSTTPTTKTTRVAPRLPPGKTLHLIVFHKLRAPLRPKPTEQRCHLPRSKQPSMGTAGSPSCRCTRCTKPLRRFRQTRAGRSRFASVLWPIVGTFWAIASNWSRWCTRQCRMAVSKFRHQVLQAACNRVFLPARGCAVAIVAATAAAAFHDLHHGPKQTKALVQQMGFLAEPATLADGIAYCIVSVCDLHVITAANSVLNALLHNYRSHELLFAKGTTITILFIGQLQGS
mmetsp:Transcript_12873/g.34892  ORF Transcript_12873/g.34892 Transcript_12873/m.34892 type:complete len:231 (+) Transcript_12873:49-741(+)